MAYQAYSVSWNLTQRCNLFCVHCYMSAFPQADVSGDFTTEECFKVMDDMAKVNPDIFLILTGGEPLVRKDIFDIAAYGADKGFTCVLGTNGVLLGKDEAKAMRRSGLQGASVSLDSVDPEKHDAFRQLAGSWKNAVRGTRFLREEGLDFSLHMSVMSWNVSEIPRMIDLARDLGAKVLNFFFLVQTGRGENLIDIDPGQYEEILTYLARAQGVGTREAASGGTLFDRFEDPWASPAGRSGVFARRGRRAHDGDRGLGLDLRLGRGRRRRRGLGRRRLGRHRWRRGRRLLAGLVAWRRLGSLERDDLRLDVRAAGAARHSEGGRDRGA